MKIDVSALRKLEEEKLISIQQHETLPLLIHNYTPVCQFGRNWNELTTLCRGLITDLEGNIVSRAFHKFFNIEEHFGEDCKLPPINWKQKFLATEKLDGSLGITYPTPKGVKIATRGSFSSDQALRAMEIFKRKGYDKFYYPDGLTFLFEIIYPENRIVVDYRGMEDLILLDVIDNETGEGKPYSSIVEFAQKIGCPVVRELLVNPEEIQVYGSKNLNNEEGIVVRFDDGMRVKVKFEEYKRLHRLVTGCSARSIWENLKSGQDLSELLERVPDEFNEWVKKTVAKLQDEYSQIMAEAMNVLARINTRLGFASRKEYAIEIVKHPKIASILFHLMDKKNPDQLIWKLVKPASTKPFHQDIDS